MSVSNSTIWFMMSGHRINRDASINIYGFPTVTLEKYISYTNINAVWLYNVNIYIKMKSKSNK